MLLELCHSYMFRQRHDVDKQIDWCSSWKGLTVIFMLIFFTQVPLFTLIVLLECFDGSIVTFMQILF